MATRLESPHDYLPIKDPRYNKLPRTFFYDNVIKPLILDTVRVCSNGIPIDLNKIKDLDNEITNILNNNKNILKNNIIIKNYLYTKNKCLIANLVNNTKTEFVTKDKFIGIEFNYLSDKIHRSYVVNRYLNSIDRYREYIIKEWLLSDLKKLNMIISSNFISKLLNKGINNDNEYVLLGKEDYIKDKVRIYNKKKACKIKTGLKKLKENSEFNPNSSTQKSDLFSMLDIDIEEKTKSGNDSTGKDVINKLLIEYKLLVDSNPNNQKYKDILEIIEVFYNQSSAAIIKNTFIKNFYLHTVDSVLYSSLHLFGAKSFRYTSSNPNMLNLPSTGSKFAKSFKKCLVAPKGYVIYTCDYAALNSSGVLYSNV